MSAFRPLAELVHLREAALREERAVAKALARDFSLDDAKRFVGAREKAGSLFETIALFPVMTIEEARLKAQTVIDCIGNDVAENLIMQRMKGERETHRTPSPQTIALFLALDLVRYMGAGRE